MLCEAGRSQSERLKRAAALLKAQRAHSPLRAVKMTLGFIKSSAGVKITLLIVKQKNVSNKFVYVILLCGIINLRCNSDFFQHTGKALFPQS